MTDLERLCSLLHRDGVQYNVTDYIGHKIVSWSVPDGMCWAFFNLEGKYTGVERDFQ